MDLHKLSKQLGRMLRSCALCGHQCKADRFSGKKGFCRAPYTPVLSSAMAHHGEEPPISGTRGSGTLFFAHCNMACVYCQNYQISQMDEGNAISIDRLAGHMLRLQNSGCHNINVVSPTVWVPQIIAAWAQAKQDGLHIPLVYNTGGYDHPQVIKMLDQAVDIYMPDMRYSDDQMAYQYSKVKQYTKYNRESVMEMYRQVGPLEVDKHGVAVKGLMVRLLVLPNQVGGVIDTLNFIKQNLSADVYLSIMAQYHPVYRAADFSPLNRGIQASEYRQVVQHAQKLGFEWGFIQDHVFLNDDPFLPDFNKKNVFRYYEQD